MTKNIRVKKLLDGFIYSNPKNLFNSEPPKQGMVEQKRGDMGGVKFDQDKIRYDLLPPELLEAVADILTFGAKKYSDRNWEKGMKWSRPFGALMRHMWDWWRKEDRDPETGKTHLWHAACCLAFLIAYEDRGSGEDDRPSG